MGGGVDEQRVLDRGRGVAVDRDQGQPPEVETARRAFHHRPEPGVALEGTTERQVLRVVGEEAHPRVEIVTIEREAVAGEEVDDLDLVLAVGNGHAPVRPRASR